MIQQFLTGAVKSKTMQANLTAAGSLIAFWNSEALSALPEIAKYIILGVLGINVVLRTVTNSSLMAKGFTKKQTDILSISIAEDVVNHLQQSGIISPRLMEQLEKNVADTVFKKLVAHMKKPTPPGKVSAAIAKSGADATQQ